MVIDVVGAGSLGLLYGGKLRAAGHAVRFWTRTPEQAEELRVHGLTITEQGKKTKLLPQHIQPYPITELSAHWHDQPGDWLLLMVKQTSIDDVIHIMETMRDYTLNIVCFQNGMGHIEKIQAALPLSSIYRAVTTEGAKRVEYGVIRAGEGETWFGRDVHTKEIEKDTSGNLEEVRLEALLQQAGFNCTASNQIDKLIYRKLLINAVINPLTAIWRIPNGELLQNDYRLKVMRHLYDEASAIYKASDIIVGIDMWEEILSVCRSTASNTSSMLADVMQGRRTEVESISGQMVQLAHRCGLTAPQHELMLHLIEGIRPEGVS
ncbi:2-dehydropantoate 2-reductase [Paenibacillus sp. ACRRY]|uniref:ketopantoate reductase family protein n=1 Tax=Paenibacillus sp. ACRRY TaxID=2918208 RepID=UPI001EF4EF5F|nr:2-dehydropantoate 2-reductase [Paenibacillus sp. ACRRY]MCG7383260.1 2-dehydropantoate 2-reductase [Paenibacillus sp. ACRRY]